MENYLKEKPLELFKEFLLHFPDLKKQALSKDSKIKNEGKTKIESYIKRIQKELIIISENANISLIQIQEEVFHPNNFTAYEFAIYFEYLLYLEQSKKPSKKIKKKLNKVLV
jgi:hypothetical protein